MKLWRRLVALALRHPIVVLVVVASTARAATALTSFILHSGSFIGDELQYLELARTVAAGRSADSWQSGYGQQLYDSTRAFTAPLALLTRLFGDARLVGQLWAALWGVITAGLSTRLALVVVERRMALLAGLVVALMPSQVLWSSVVVRESMVWAALVGVALAIAMIRPPSRVIAARALACAGLALLALGRLRSQTLLVAALALPVAVAFGGRRWLLARMPVAVLLALLAPAAAGLGIGGWHFARLAAPSLGATRATLADDARTAVSPVTTIAAGDAQASGLPPVTQPRRAVPIAERNHPQVDTPDGRVSVLAWRDGGVSIAEEGSEATLRQVPRGIAATLLRPYPWEPTASVSASLARMENLIWYALYVLAAVGAWRGRRRLRVLAYPMVVAVGIVAVGAVSHGNIGTALRHRGQILWVLALLAAVALDRQSSGGHHEPTKSHVERAIA